MALSLSENAAALSAAMVLLLAGIVLSYGAGVEGDWRIKMIFYRSLDEIDQQIIKAVWQAEESKSSTMQGIMERYEKIRNEQLDEEKILQELERLQRCELVKQVIINEQDQPRKIWTLNMPYRDHKLREHLKAIFWPR
jgi:hypothetical protein